MDNKVTPTYETASKAQDILDFKEQFRGVLDRLTALEERRVSQSSIPPQTIKRRHIGEDLSEVFVSNIVLSEMVLASTSYVNFTPNISITFSPNFNKKYIIFGNFPIYIETADESCALRISDSIGNSDIIVQPETSTYTIPGGQDVKSCYVYMIANLQAGKNYTFTLQGRVTSGNLRILDVMVTTGFFLIAQSI